MKLFLEWNTKKGLMIMDFNKLLDLANKINKA